MSKIIFSKRPTFRLARSLRVSLRNSPRDFQHEDDENWVEEKEKAIRFDKLRSIEKVRFFNDEKTLL